jgi:cytosine/adenosine deaminase-related metal-dependent hydrolase
MTDSLLIKDATVVTLDERNRIFDGDVLIEQGRIASTGSSIPSRGMQTIDGRGRLLLPGFVQTHVHLCQTLFRGAADDLSLIDWLRNAYGLWKRLTRATRFPPLRG